MKYATFIAGVLITAFSACSKSEPEVPLPTALPKCEAKLENVQLQNGVLTTETDNFFLRMEDSPTQTYLRVDHGLPEDRVFDANDTMVNDYHQNDGSIDYLFIGSRRIISDSTYLSKDEWQRGDCGWLLEGEADLGDYSCEDVRAFVQEAQKVFDCYVPKLRKEKYRLSELQRPIDYSLTLDQVLEANEGYSIPKIDYAPEINYQPKVNEDQDVDCLVVGGMVFDCKEIPKKPRKVERKVDCLVVGGMLYDCR